MKVLDPETRITLHEPPSKNHINFKLEAEIYNWICFNRSLGNPVTTWAIAIEVKKRSRKGKAKTTFTSDIYISIFSKA